jgi:hypothetical protein
LRIGRRDARRHTGARGGATRDRKTGGRNR